MLNTQKQDMTRNQNLHRFLFDLSEAEDPNWGCGTPKMKMSKPVLY